MPRPVRSLPLAAALLLAASVSPSPRVLADEGKAGPAAPAQADAFDQTDRKKVMSIRLPRSWKSAKSEEQDERALATFAGNFTADKGPNGFVMFYADSPFARGLLARAVDLPRQGEVIDTAMRDGAGWVEGCANDTAKRAVFRRYVEKNGRVYVFQVLTHRDNYASLRGEIEQILDTAAVPGEFAPLPLGEAFAPKKSGDFDVLTDAEADRKSAIELATTTLGAGRDAAMKALPGKPFDASRPVAWVFQNGQKFEDRGKAATGVVPKLGLFNAGERSAMVSILSQRTTGNEEMISNVGAEQYVWQYFGGEPPVWLRLGLAKYGEVMAMGGGKGKLAPDAIGKARTAVNAAKRRLDEWFDVPGPREITDVNQASNELFAWHWYFRNAKGGKKLKKQYDAYLQSLRDTGDPAAARKAFDGVNFAELLADFKGWVGEWK